MVYSSIKLAGNEARQWLENAMESFLRCTDIQATVLWSLTYSQQSTSEGGQSSEDPELEIHDRNIIFSDPSVDLAFDDRVLREVRRVWQQVTGSTSGFMEFADREVGEYDDE